MSDKDGWYNPLKREGDGLVKTPFNELGNYKRRSPPEPEKLVDKGTDEPEDSDGSKDDKDFRASFAVCSQLNVIFTPPDPAMECFDSEVNSRQDADKEPATTEWNERNDTKGHPLRPPGTRHQGRHVARKPIDYEKYRPFFLHVPKEKVRRTFEATTRYATNVMSGRNILQTLKSPYPANNVWRRNEPVATDTIYATTPAVRSGGQKMAQIFIGRKSLVIDVYGMTNEREFVNSFEDVIRKRGAMDVLISCLLYTSDAADE